MNLAGHGKPVSSSSRGVNKKLVVLTTALGVLAMSGWCGSLAYLNRTASDETRAAQWVALTVAPAAPIDTKLIPPESSEGPIEQGPDSVDDRAVSQGQSTAERTAEPTGDHRAPSQRVAGLGQFGQPGMGAPDRGGGNRFGNGGPGAGNGRNGFGQGPGGAGPGGDAGGGVSIDPVIQLQTDRTGSLEKRRKASISQQPSRGAFATP